MIKFTNRKRLVFQFAIIIAGQILFSPLSFAQAKGVIIDQAGAFRFRQEIRPFVPLQGEFLLDPSRGEIILLFPKQQEAQIAKPAESEVKTEKIVIRKTNIKTEIGTQRGTSTNKSK